MSDRNQVQDRENHVVGGTLLHVSFVMLMRGQGDGRRARRYLLGVPQESPPPRRAGPDLSLIHI
ncbi:MAG: hypothetical protein QUU85_06440 [Candidatus Eisenbacteria bacterium]|nr:hypothetical protein [Candidatus Eisenbacteria bacterium]